MDQCTVQSFATDLQWNSTQDENPLDQPGGWLVCRRICHDEYKTKTYTSQPCGIPHTQHQWTQREGVDRKRVWTDRCICIWKNSTSISLLAWYGSTLLDSSMVQNLHRSLIKIIRNKDGFLRFGFLIVIGFYHARTQGTLILPLWIQGVETLTLAC